MRMHPHQPATDRVILVGTGAIAMAALWRLRAAGLSVRWYADRADIGEETVLAQGLGGGRIELSFDDPLAASLEGASAIVIADARRGDAKLAERARASGVPVHFIGEAELPGIALAGRIQTARRVAATA
jgi:hypothetical protein